MLFKMMNMVDSKIMLLFDLNRFSANATLHNAVGAAARDARLTPGLGIESFDSR